MGLRSPPLVAALRRFDPFPEAILALDFAGVRTGGRQFYKRDGIIVPRFEMLRGAFSVGHAGFGRTRVNGAYPPFAPGAPLIGDGGLSVPEAQQNIWPRNDGAPPGDTWTTNTGSSDRTAGSIESIIAGAIPVLMTTTTTNGRVQRNISVPNDTLTRTFTVWLEKKAVTYLCQVGISGGSVSIRSVNFNGATGVPTAIADGASINSDGPYWRVDIPITNNASGAALFFCLIDLVGPAGLSANILCPMVTVGPSILGPPIVTTGLPVTRTACGIGVPQPADTTQGTVIVEGTWPLVLTPNASLAEPSASGLVSAFSLAVSPAGSGPRARFFAGPDRIDAFGAAVSPGAPFKIGLSWGQGALPRASFSGAAGGFGSTPAFADFNPAHLLSLGSRSVGQQFWLNSGKIARIRWLPDYLDQALLNARTAL